MLNLFLLFTKNKSFESVLFERKVSLVNILEYFYFVVGIMCGWDVAASEGGEVAAECCQVQY